VAFNDLGFYIGYWNEINTFADFSQFAVRTFN